MQGNAVPDQLSEIEGPRAKSCALITDGRFFRRLIGPVDSGTFTEAAEGGLIGLVKDGGHHRTRYFRTARSRLAVDETEISARRAAMLRAGLESMEARQSVIAKVSTAATRPICRR